MKRETQMQDEKPRKGTALKIFTWIVVISAGIVLLIFFGVPLFLSSSGGTNMLVGKINQAVDGQVQMDDLSVGWFKGIKATNVTYADSAGTTSVKVGRIEAQPKLGALLGGKVKLGKTLIEKPEVYIKVADLQGTGDAPQKAASKEQAPPVFPVQQIDLEVREGKATVELPGTIPQTVTFTNIASKVQLAEAGKPSSLDVSMNVDDSSQISAKGQATTSKTGWTLEDGDFEVTISGLKVQSLKPLLAMAGKQIDMEGELNADSKVTIQEGKVSSVQADAVITDFAQGTGEQRTAFEQPVEVSASIDGTGSDMQIKALRVKSDFCQVDCSGSMKSLDYSVNADLAQTQRFAGQFTDMAGLGMSGTLNAKGNVKMTDETIAVSGTGQARQLVVRKETVKTPMTDAKMEFDCKIDQAAKQVQIRSANLTATPGTVAISNLVLPTSGQADKTIAFDAKAKLDLEKTWPFVQVFADLPEDMKIAGQLDSSLQASTTGSQVRIVTPATRIDKLKIQKGTGDPFAEDQVTLKGDLLLDTEKQTFSTNTLSLLDAKGQPLIEVKKARVGKTFSQTNTKMTGDFEAQYDLNTVTAIAGGYLPEGLTLKGKRSDAFHFESEYPTDKPELMQANLNGNGTFGFDAASYKGLDIGPTEMKMTAEKGLVTIDIPETTANEGTFGFSGTVDLKEQPRVLRLTKQMSVMKNVHVNDTVTSSMLLYTNPIFANAVRTSGIATLDCRQLEIPLSGGHKDKITIDATVNIQQLKLQPGDFLGDILSLVKADKTAYLTIQPTDFKLAEGFLSYPQMQIDVGGTSLNFGGRIGLNKALEMDIQLPLTLSGEIVKAGDSAANRITLPIEGTLTSPKINTAKLIEKQGQKLIEDTIRKGLDNLFR